MEGIASRCLCCPRCRVGGGCPRALTRGLRARSMDGGGDRRGARRSDRVLNAHAFNCGCASQKAEQGQQIVQPPNKRTANAAKAMVCCAARCDLQIAHLCQLHRSCCCTPLTQIVFVPMWGVEWAYRTRDPRRRWQSGSRDRLIQTDGPLAGGQSLMPSFSCRSLGGALRLEMISLSTFSTVHTG